MNIIVVSEASKEPVLFETVKNYLRIDHNYEDDLLKMLIEASRSSLELFTGLSFKRKELKCTFVYCSPFHIPYGPLVEVTSLKDSEGEELDATEYTLTNNHIIINGGSGEYTIEYVAGFEELPADLKLAIMKEAVTQYEVRENIAVGTISADLSNSARKLAMPYRQVLWIL